LENKIDIDSVELKISETNISYKIYNKNNSTKILELNNKKEKTTRVGQIIKLLDGIEPYDIIEELQNTPANITLAQLIGISNALRSDITKSFKKVRTEDDDAVVGCAEYHNDIEEFEIVNNPTHCYATREIQEHDISIVNGTVNGHSAAVLIDGGSNTNLVTRNFLNKNIKNYTIVGSTSGRVHQALSNTEERVYEIVKLEVQIGTLKINAVFRVFDNDDSIFDIIINLKTQADYKLLVDADSKYLYVKSGINNVNGVFTFSAVPLVPLEDVHELHTQCMFCYILENNTSINNVISTNKINTTNKNKILEELISNMDIKDENFKNEIKSILTSYSDVIAISSDDLEPSKLLPHHIELLEGSKPIKQKAYRISQVQLLALKEELKKINRQRINFTFSFTLVFTYRSSTKEKW